MARDQMNEGGRRERKGRRWPVALPNAMASAALFGAIALGATSAGAIGLVTATAPICQDEQGNVIDCPSTAPTPPSDGSGGGTSGGTEPTPPVAPPTPPSNDGTGAGAGSGSTDGTGSGAGAGTGSNDEPKPGHKPHPRPETMGLTLALVDGGVKLDWTACTADGFDAYKIVRSADPMVRWPRGWRDRMVGVITDRGTTEYVDTNAPAGRKVWYRVFCVHKTDHGFRVLDSTPARRIKTHEAPHPAPTPAPTPVTMGFEAGLGDGGVVLHWDVCKADGFHWYKVVRSHGDNPSYVPHTDGSELIGVIENSATTGFTDSHVESGQTWFYRVQCVAFQHGEKVLLGQTAALQVTIP